MEKSKTPVPLPAVSSECLLSEIREAKKKGWLHNIRKDHGLPLYCALIGAMSVYAVGLATRETLDGVLLLAFPAGFFAFCGLLIGKSLMIDDDRA